MMSEMAAIRRASYLLGIGASAAMLAACGGGQIGTAPSGVMPQAASQPAAVPACLGSRIGRAQCDVLVERGAQRNTSIAGWHAADLEAAYDLPVTTQGKGQSIYVVDAYDNPDVENDFATYRAAMGLPAGTLVKYNQDGQQSNYPQGSPGWGVEIDLDVEMASASCPLCTVDLVEASSNSWSDIEAAEAEAVTLGGTIISNSYSGSGGSESYYDTRGVTYVASSGDSGSGLYDPATFQRVVAAGGTFLSRADNKRGFVESVWKDSGGGCSSTGESKPYWQHDTYCEGRLGSDVSAVAVGAAEYDSYSEGGWITVDGTSISSPFIAGIFGLAGNSTKQVGGKTFWYRGHWKYLYIVGKGDLGDGLPKRFTTQGGFGSPHGIRAF